MRFLNKRQMKNIPMADAGNLYLGDMSDAAEANRERLHQQNAAKARLAARQRAQVLAHQRNQSKLREIAAQKHAAMLKRSLNNNGQKVVSAASMQGMGFTPKFGITNPLLGFVDETTDPNYTQSEVYNAQEFNNRLTAKDNKNYLKFKDYPLVIDSPRGDFGGLLVDEKHSADFSTRIVNDAKSDFGYAPRHRRKRR